MDISVVRLSRSCVSSPETLASIRGKEAYDFGRSSGDGGRVIGSRDGEHCLLRILLKSINGVPIPIERIQAVQAVCISSDETRELGSIAVTSTPVQWTVSAVLDPATLTRLADKAQPSTIRDGRQKSDFDFEVRLVIVLPDSSRPMLAVCRTVSWRLVPRHSLMIGQLSRRLKLKGLRPLPQVLRQGLRLHRTS